MDNESIDLAAMLAYELQDPSTKARLLARIAARCASSGRKVDAIRYAKEAMSLAEADNSPLQKVLVAADAAHVYFLCENRDIALRTLLWAVDAVSQLDLR